MSIYDQFHPQNTFIVVFFINRQLDNMFFFIPNEIHYHRLRMNFQCSLMNCPCKRKMRRKHLFTSFASVALRYSGVTSVSDKTRIISLIKMNFYASDGAIIAKSHDERGMNVNMNLWLTYSDFLSSIPKQEFHIKRKREWKIFARFWNLLPSELNVCPTIS